MSTGRVLWIIWCLLWAAFWFFAGIATLLGWIITWPLAVVALLMILVPVGKPARVTCPACGATGDPAHLQWHMQAAHQGRPAPMINVWPAQAAPYPPGGMPRPAAAPPTRSGPVRTAPMPPAVAHPRPQPAPGRQERPTSLPPTSPGPRHSR